MAAPLRADGVGADRPRPQLRRRPGQRARPTATARRRRARRSRRSARSTATTSCTPATSSRSATPPTPSRRNRAARDPNRVENGQTAIVQSVDPARDTLTLILHEPGVEPRLVRDRPSKAARRARRRQTRRRGAAQLRDAQLPRPRRDRPWHRHPRGTLVPGQTRNLRRRHPGDLPPHRPPRPRRPRHRRHRRRPRQPLRAANLREPPTPREHPLRPDPRVELAVRLPDHRTLPSTAAASSSDLGAGDTSLQTSTATSDARHIATAASATDPPPRASNIDQHQAQLARSEEHRTGVLDDPPEHLLHAPGRPRRAHRTRTAGARSPATRGATRLRQRRPAARPGATRVTRRIRQSAWFNAAPGASNAAKRSHDQT